MIATASAEVHLAGVVKQYGAHRALDGIDLRVGAGEMIALLGPSGCGKTTALRSIAGLESIDSGVIRIGDDDVSRVPTNKRDLGMVFQSYSLFPHLTSQQNVEFGLRMRGVGTAERRKRAGEALELVGLGHLGARYAHELSGGQQQRVALARALVTRPRVLLLDEPLSALDAKVRVQLREQIRAIQTELGITALFVTHDQEEALAVADRVAVMRAGRIEQIGSPEELYGSPATPFVADFVGVSSQVPGRLTGGTVEVHGVTLPVLGDAPRDGAVLAYIRPEDVAFAESGIPAVVVSTSFLGAARRTLVRLPDESVLAVQHAAGTRTVPGERLHVALNGRPVSVRSAE
ncbi:putative spermidine/putrescine transport system ATP-binding protein [Diaminobutyricimonas aerilata]|uniref:ABC-type quaternary amine transporter n=1 Tax=Diaminobutyricimonas aerilata TaxID=1162967 RepID=A0A2M9CHY5_9MICO|nr:ABC transporter ATP-binding protein [Diaminobutyricimonas aerilata]PJJ71498.1 putative spermidine/putrescine transport system ATP-binding protein [Diaminobutyricimonas aerilata]